MAEGVRCPSRAAAAPPRLPECLPQTRHKAERGREGRKEKGREGKTVGKVRKEKEDGKSKKEKGKCGKSIEEKGKRKGKEKHH